MRAIKCIKPHGHAAEPWKTWAILYNLELADSNPTATQTARQKAINAFLAYRRDGGENHDGAGRLALDVLQAIKQNNTAEMQQVIEELLTTWKNKTYLHHLQAIIKGDRNPALAEDSEMNYQLVVELKLLLEQLRKS